MSMLFATLFVGVFSSNAFAHVKSSHAHKHTAGNHTTTIVLCAPDKITPQTGSTPVPDSNDSYCGQIIGIDPGFSYVAANSGTSAKWIMSANTVIENCTDIEVWIPNKNANDTSVRYDFWSSELHWIGWVGFDINQANSTGYVKIGGWTNSPIIPPLNTSDLEVTAQDYNNPNAANEQLAFAAMKFTCTFSD